MTAVLLALLLFLPSFGHALKEPSKAESDGIQAAIKNARFENESDHDKEYQRLNDEKIAFEQALGLRGKDRNLLPEVNPEDIEWKKALAVLAGSAYDPEQVAKKYNGLGREEKARYAAILKEFKPFQEESNRLHQKAIELARLAYGIDPPTTSGPILSGAPCHKLPDNTPDPDYVECHIGKQATWRPAFSENLGSAAGKTYGDGHVSIGPNAFSNPGYLAYALYHEGRHFQDYQTTAVDLPAGVDFRNEPAVEVDRREKDKPLLTSAFHFEKEDLDKFDDKLEKERDRARQWDQKLSAGLDPYKKKDRDQFPQDADLMFMKDGKPQSIKEMVRKIQEKADKLKADIERREADMSRIRWTVGMLAVSACNSPGSATQDTLDSLSSYPPELAIAVGYAVAASLPEEELRKCANRLQVEICVKLGKGEKLDATWVNSSQERYGESERQRQRRELASRIEFEAGRCGFNALNNENGYEYGFQYVWPADKHSRDSYYFKNSVDLDVAKVGLFLTRACKDARWINYEEKPPCNDGLDIINRRWSDKSFREMLEFEVIGSAWDKECLRSLAGNLRTPLDINSLARGVRQRWNDWHESPPSSGGDGLKPGNGPQPVPESGRDPSGNGRRGNGVGDGDGPTKKKAEGINGSGQWPQ